MENYPYGFRLRTSIFYWIETQKGKGDRFCSYTINPKNGRTNKPKKSTYNTFMYMHLDEQGHVTYSAVNPSHIELFEVGFNDLLNRIGISAISKDQIDNIRIAYYRALRKEASYRATVYPEDDVQNYTEWATGKLKHILTCDFKELLAYPDKPAAMVAGENKNSCSVNA